jgi:ubiquinone/menaquinone biosynthesis C-methylase UbiE
MLVTSRSFSEYQAMFGLDASVTTKRVLDCCAGSASFVAELTDRGGTAIAADPAYALPPAELTKIQTDGGTGVERIIDDNYRHFTWNWYGSPERRQAMRQEAANRFATDFSANQHRYVAAALPHLPFVTDAFDLVLCSHLLFTWSNTYDADWHYAALAEMLRVSRGEVRVFPLVAQGTAQPVGFFDDVISRIADDGYDVELRRVPYEFQRGANTMLLATSVSS